MTEADADEYETWRERRLKKAHEDEVNAQWLTELLEPIAKKLGLHVRVFWDGANWCWYVDAELRVNTRCSLSFDEELFFAIDPKSKARVFDTVLREMEHLQDIAFDKALTAMQALDARGRTFLVSHEDRGLLHEMISDLENFAYAEGCYNRSGPRSERVNKYRAFLERFFR